MYPRKKSSPRPCPPKENKGINYWNGKLIIPSITNKKLSDERSHLIRIERDNAGSSIKKRFVG